VQDFVAELAAIGESDPQEPSRDVDLAEIVRLEVRALESRAARSRVTVVLRTGADDPSTAHVYGRAAPRAAAAIVRALLAHAILASPRGSQVVVTVLAAEGGAEGPGPREVVDDQGTTLPAVARRALLALEVEPGTFGRPSGVALFAAAEMAAAQGGRLEVSDAPAVDGGRGHEAGGGGGGTARDPASTGGLRASVSFPR
jgi:hypothetical protein